MSNKAKRRMERRMNINMHESEFEKMVKRTMDDPEVKVSMEPSYDEVKHQEELAKAKRRKLALLRKLDYIESKVTNVKRDLEDISEDINKIEIPEKKVQEKSDITGIIVAGVLTGIYAALGSALSSLDIHNNTESTDTYGSGVDPDLAEKEAMNEIASDYYNEETDEEVI